jgi:Sulfatase
MREIDCTADLQSPNFSASFGAFVATVFLYLSMILVLELMFRYSASSFVTGLSAVEILTSFSGLFFLLTLPAVLFSVLCYMLHKMGLWSSARISGTILGFAWILLWIPFAYLEAVYFGKWAYATFQVDGKIAGALSFLYFIPISFLILAIIHKKSKEIKGFVHEWKRGIVIIWAVCTIPFLIAAFTAGHHHSGLPWNLTAAKKPNIIMITGEGLDSERMSLYGYPTKNTPFLEELAKTSCLFRRAYANANTTGSSIPTLFNGKLPTTTGIVDYFKALKGRHQIEHLPRILRALDYLNADYCHYFAFKGTIHSNPARYNLRDGFDVVQGKRMSTSGPISAYLREKGMALYWLEVVAGEASKNIESLMHLLGGSTSETGFPTPLDNVLDLIKSRQSRLFIHIHDLTTHKLRGHFVPPERHFSRNRPDEESSYDDTILAFDRNVASIVKALKAAGTYDNTLLVVTSDHRSTFRARGRTVPLLIHFPGQTSGSLITSPVAHVDIAPTILDYLSVGVPHWMDGISLLSFIQDKARGRERPIFQLAFSLPRYGRKGSVIEHLEESWVGTVVTDDYIFTKTRGSENAVLYDAGTYPAVRDNLFFEKPRIRDKLLQIWQRYMNLVRNPG